MNIQAIGNWFLFVGQQWASSLKVFLPKNFKLFVLVTLNAWWQGVKTFFKYFWWLFFLQLFFINNLNLRYLSVDFLGINIKLYTLIEYLPYFLMILAIRPSVKLKTYRYYGSYVFQYLIVVIFLNLFVFFNQWLLSYFGYFGRTIEFSTGLLTRHDFIFNSPLVYFFIFFYLDSSGELLSAVKSVWRGFKMFFYSIPFLIITMITLAAALLFFALTFSRMLYQTLPVRYLNLFSPLLAWLIFMLFPAILNNFYLKRVHEDFELYFK